MARSTIEHGGTSGSVCGPEDESNAESSHARRRSSFINQAPHDPSKRPIITLDGGGYCYLFNIHLLDSYVIYMGFYVSMFIFFCGFADTKVSRTITTIFKNMFNGSWTTLKEGMFGICFLVWFSGYLPDVTRERGLWNMLIAAAGAFSSDLEQIHDFVFGMGQNRDVQNTLPGLVFFLMSLPKGVFRICLLLQQGRLVPT
ncbi:hypothetical protein Tco_0500423 [Tanacetum coccineum]